MFTECLPEQIPARARITTRARRLAAEAIGDHTRPVSGVAAEFGMDWRVAHDAFVAHAAQVLPEQPPPVTCWASTRPAAARPLRDRPHHRGEDLGGPLRHRPGRSERQRRAVRQVNGRTSKVLIEWLQAQDPDWLANITHISMDTSATYARAARLALPDAVVVVDRFHLSALANKAVTDYRRELAGRCVAGGAARATRNGRNGTGCCAPWRLSLRTSWPRCGSDAPGRPLRRP